MDPGWDVRGSGSKSRGADAQARSTTTPELVMSTVLLPVLLLHYILLTTWRSLHEKASTL